MLRQFIIFMALLTGAAASHVANDANATEPPLSEATEACLECHSGATPNIVANWRKSRMAQTTPALAMQKDSLARRISAEKVPEELLNVTVGCAECHTLNPDKHPGTYEHGEYQVHTVVSSADCSTCHPVEKQQYNKNLMAHAYGNLVKNPLNMDFANQVNGSLKYEAGRLVHALPSPETESDSCLHCHGTNMKVLGDLEIENEDYGSVVVKKLSGWPNTGVGRINPDGSMGACTACHPRHIFDIETARKPSTCSQCHKGPDVPVYKIYQVSKHGSIYDARGKGWDFGKVPWIVGQDFEAPTCATCHVSLLTDPEGNVRVQRSHQMVNRIWKRIFGLPYAAPMPNSPDTSIIVNKDGLNMPTAWDGTPAEKYLIGAEEQGTRKAEMRQVCTSCHGSQWADSQLRRLDDVIKVTNQITLASTDILLKSWQSGLARGPGKKDSPFNEDIERMWVKSWLFYSNSIRLSTAMMGADYGVFDNGRFWLTHILYKMAEKVRTESRQK